MRGFVLGIVFTLVVLAIVGWIAVHTGAIPANADAKPGGFELWAAHNALRSALHNQAPKGANPVPLTDANLIEGVKLYGQDCAVCHGTSGGKAQASPIARGEYPAPPQLATDGVEDDPQGYTYWKIKHGIRLTGMPSWRSTLNDQQIWTLALFLNRMDKLPPAAEAAWTALPPPMQPAPEAPKAPLSKAGGQQQDADGD